MANASGDQSPESEETCCDGCCGPIDYDFLFQPNQIKADEKIDDETKFHLLLLEAEQNINKGELSTGLHLYNEAYNIAWDTEALGLDACFAVMFHVHYFNFYLDAFRMCVQMTGKAIQAKDISLVQDIWRLLPEIGNGTEIHEMALLLRHDIETNHPEVLTHVEKSGRL